MWGYPHDEGPLHDNMNKWDVKKVQGFVVYVHFKFSTTLNLGHLSRGGGGLTFL